MPKTNTYLILGQNVASKDSLELSYPSSNGFGQNRDFMFIFEDLGIGITYASRS